MLTAPDGKTNTPKGKQAVAGCLTYSTFVSQTLNKTDRETGQQVILGASLHTRHRLI